MDATQAILAREESTHNGDVRNKILYVLSIYGRLSPSMVQTGIGTSVRPVVWRPVLAKLVDDGVVERHEVMGICKGRQQIHTVYSIATGFAPDRSSGVINAFQL